jgi:hypothetical protein
MNLQRCCAIALLALTSSLPACAQTISHLQNTRREVGSPPTVFPASAPATLESRLMPMDRIEKPIPLEDPLAAPRSAIPDFNSVVVRDDGVPQQYPTLPVMTLKNVTVGQFLQFVQASFPSVQILRIDGPPGALYSIRIRADDKFLASMDQDRVRLYRLSEIINGLADEKARSGKDSKDANRDERIKGATNDVLSLLQAALDQTDPNGPPGALKIHEPTLTLMFKGSRAKQQILEEALTTLQPRPGRAGKFGGYAPTGNPWQQSLQPQPRDVVSDYLQALGRQDAAMQERLREDARKLKSITPAPSAPPAPEKQSKD